MLTEIGVPGTDDWWVARLAKQLGDGLPRMELIRSHRDGDALLPDNAWDRGTRDSYKRFVKRARLHVVETIRDARTDRQRVVGFRTGAEGDENGDELAWSHWMRSKMPFQTRLFFNDIADYGEAFLLTLPEEAENLPVFVRYNGWNAAVETDPTRPWLTIAGITYGFDAILEQEVVVLYRPGYYRIAVRPAKTPSLAQDGSPWVMGSDWDWSASSQTPWTTDALLRRAATTDGYGIYEKHLDHIDRINEITLNALTLIVMQSFRQRGVKGNLPTHYPEGHPEAGKEINYDELFEAGPAALWMLPVGTDIWESQQTDVRPIFEARKDELQALCSITRTPQDIFAGQSNNQSAMGAETSKEPLKYAVENMNDIVGITIGDSLADAFRITGDQTRGDATQIEVMWKKVNPATLAEKSEAAPKVKQGGASQRWIDENVFEMTPRERRLAEADRASEAFQTSFATTPTTNAAPDVNTGGLTSVGS
ncbi:MAG: hypothetical protein ACTH4Y_08085 [Microbacterium gubbeenense]|uniref:hypothetical protein n=1 Tax=Microbacterium gubbeenense TaxID=159896 RepID=UPI003F9CE2D2